MGLRSVTLLGLFVIGLVAAFANPIWGVLCYLGHYYVFPENQWWGQVLQAAGVRTSLTISAVLGLAFLMHWSRLRHQWSELLHSQEILFWLYVAVIGLGTLWAGEYSQQSAGARPPFEKMSSRSSGFRTPIAAVTAATTTAPSRGPAVSATAPSTWRHECRAGGGHFWMCCGRPYCFRRRRATSIIPRGE